MNFDYLREFLDLASTLNFTKSASNLNMTQSTLSRHVSAMERELGAQLFIRTTNSVKLTQDGRLLFEKASALVSGYSDAISEMQRRSHQTVETVNVTGSAVQPTVLRFFSRLSAYASHRNEPVRFELHKIRSFSNEPPVPYPIDALQNGDVDLVIDPCEKNGVAPEGLDRIILCDEPVVVLASRENPLCQSVDLSLEDLFANTLMVFAIQQHCVSIISSPFRHAGYSANRVKPVFVDNMLEIPERLGTLAENEIVAMQASYCSLFGFDQCLPEHICVLDVNDDRLKTSVWALFRKFEKKESVRLSVRLIEDLLEEAKAAASLDDWSDEHTLKSSALYRGSFL